MGYPPHFTDDVTIEHNKNFASIVAMFLGFSEVWKCYGFIS